MEALDYDKTTGRFTWKVHRGCVTKGTPADSAQNGGYVEIGFEDQNYLAHRLAWLIVYGRWPRRHIDHIDRDRRNNAIRNLRDVTPQQNAFNCTHGIGVTFTCGKWNAAITINAKSVHLGRYKTFKEARAAYLAAKKEFHA